MSNWTESDLRAFMHRRLKDEDRTRTKLAERLRRERISKTIMGHPVTEQTRSKISKTLCGHKVTTETRQKISESIKSNPAAMQNAVKVGNSNLGKATSSFQKAQASKANSGPNAPIFRYSHNSENPDLKSKYQRYRSGTRIDIGIFVRSSWEANYARYLNFLKANGSIQKWEYEPETFLFEEVKRGTRSYTPDFKITENDGTIIFHELKGYMSPVSKTKLNRMSKYYPDVKIRVIDKKCYTLLSKQVSKLIPNWE